MVAVRAPECLDFKGNEASLRPRIVPQRVIVSSNDLAYWSIAPKFKWTDTVSATDADEQGLVFQDCHHHRCGPINRQMDVGILLIAGVGGDEHSLAWGGWSPAENAMSA
jgi:hypothetical protein